MDTHRVLRARDADLAAPQPADDDRRHHHRRGLALRCSAGSCCCRSWVDHGTERIEGRRRARDLHEGRTRPSGQIDDVRTRARGRPATSRRYRLPRQGGRATRSSSGSSADQPDLVQNDRRRRRSPTSFRVVPDEGRAHRARSRDEFETQPGRRRGRRRPAKAVKGLLDVDQHGSGSIFIVLSRRAARVVAVPDRQHDPPRDVRPPPRDRGDEARRRVELVRARPVHGRGPRAGPRRAPGSRSSRCASLKHFGFDQAFNDRNSFFSEFFVTTGDATWIAFLVLLHRHRHRRDRRHHRPPPLPPDLTPPSLASARAVLGRCAVATCRELVAACWPCCSCG